jgi:hypothetical protein
MPKKPLLVRPIRRQRSFQVRRLGRGFNKAAVGLANKSRGSDTTDKLARIVWATWTQGRAFNGNYAQAQKAADNYSGHSNNKRPLER